MSVLAQDTTSNNYSGRLTLTVCQWLHLVFNRFSRRFILQWNEIFLCYFFHSGLVEYWDKNSIFIQNEIRKMRFPKCELFENSASKNVNFVKNENSEMWILRKMIFQIGEFCEKWYFRNVNFWENWDFRNVNFVKIDTFKMWIFG